MLLVFGASSCTSARAKLRADVRPVTAARTTLPFPPGAIDVGFVAGPTHIYVSWLEAGTDEKGTLRVAAWDGTAWAAAETIAADVDLVAAGGRKPTLGVRSDGTRVAHWFDSRDLQRGRSAWFAVSTDGGPWSSPTPLPSTIGEGFAPLAWSDVTLPPSAAWIAPHKQPLRAAVDGIFVAIPNPRDSSQMQVGLVEPRVNSLAGVDTLELGPGFYVGYLAETKVNEAGFLAAFRKLGRLNSPSEDVAHVEAVFVPRDGRSLVLFAGEGDRLGPDARLLHAHSLVVAQRVCAL